MGNSKFIEDFEIMFEGEALYENDQTENDQLVNEEAGNSAGEEALYGDYSDEESEEEEYYDGEYSDEEYSDEEYSDEEYSDEEYSGEEYSEEEYYEEAGGEELTGEETYEEEETEEGAEPEEEEVKKPVRTAGKKKGKQKAEAKPEAEKRPKPKKKSGLKKFLKVFIPIFILILGGLIGFYFYKLNKIKTMKEAAGSGVEMTGVEIQDISNSVAVTGSIVANKTRNVSTLVSNIKVETVSVNVGDYVNKGDPICTFDTEALEGKIARLQKEMYVTASKAQIDQMDANTRLAWTFQDSVNSSIEKEEAVQAAVREYNAAERNLGEMKIQLDEAQEKYDKKDSDENEKALRQAELAVASAKDSVQATVEHYNSAVRAKEDNAKQVYRTVSENQETIENTRLDGLTTNDSARTDLTELQRQLSNCNVTAPISEVVTSISVAEGDEYSEKSTICVIQDDSIFKVKGLVDQYDIASIKEGQEAVVKTTATGDDKLEGTVTFVAIVPQSSSSSSSGSGSSTSTTASTASTSYEVEITLKKKDPRLRIGMSAETSILIDKRTGVYTLPYDCVETGPDGNSYINVVQDSVETAGDGDAPGLPAENTDEYSGPGGFFKVIFAKQEEVAESAKSETVPTKKVQVKVGLETDYYVEIISDEIKEGDQVLNIIDDDAGGGEGEIDSFSIDHNDGGEEPF